MNFFVRENIEQPISLNGCGPADVELSLFKQACQQAALLTKFDRRLSPHERAYLDAAKHYLEIALRNDDTRKTDA